MGRRIVRCDLASVQRFALRRFLVSLGEVLREAKVL